MTALDFYFEILRYFKQLYFPKHSLLTLKGLESIVEKFEYEMNKSEFRWEPVVETLYPPSPLAKFYPHAKNAYPYIGWSFWGPISVGGAEFASILKSTMEFTTFAL